MSANGNGNGVQNSVQNSAVMRLGNGQLIGGNPGNSGGKKARSGRKTAEIAGRAERLLNKPKARRALEAVITNENHPHYAAMWKALADRAYGKPAQSLIVGEAPRSIDDVILAIAQRKQMQRAIAEQANGDATPRRTFRIVTEVRPGQLTAPERRAALVRELVGILREQAETAGDPELTTMVDRLAASVVARAVPEAEPDGQPFTFDINGDRPNVTLVMPHNGRDPIPPTHEIVIAREHRGVDGQPVPAAEPEPFPIGNNQPPEPPIDPARARQRARFSVG